MDYYYFSLYLKDFMRWNDPLVNELRLWLNLYGIQDKLKSCKFFYIPFSRVLNSEATACPVNRKHFATRAISVIRLILSCPVQSLSGENRIRVTLLQTRCHDVFADSEVFNIHYLHDHRNVPPAVPNMEYSNFIAGVVFLNCFRERKRMS